MIIANTAMQLQDLMMLTNLMAQLQSSEAVANLESMMRDCGFNHDGEIGSVEGAAMSIRTASQPSLDVSFKFTNTDGDEDTGLFVITVKNCKVEGDFV